MLKYLVRGRFPKIGEYSLQQPHAYQKRAKNGPEVVRMESVGVTVAEAARRLGVGERQLRRLIETGGLLAIGHGRSWVVDPVSVEDYRRRRRPTAGRYLSPRMSWAALLSCFGTDIAPT